MANFPIIPNNIINLETRNMQKNQLADPGFQELLLNAGSRLDGGMNLDYLDAKGKDDFGLNSIVDGLIENIRASLKKVGYAAEDKENIFPFSAEFESTFGLLGPLPNYINMMSAKLKLSLEQNQAFQQIAVNNKDATKTPESIQKIRSELQKAGIGY